MKKIFTLFAAVVCGMALNAKTLYLNPGPWSADQAVIFVHSWDSEDNDAQFTGSGDLLSANIPDGNNHVKLVRMPAGSTALNWDTKWNETSDLEIPSGMNMYTITGWGGTDGTWSSHSGGEGGEGGGQGGGGEDLEESGEGHDFALMGSIGGDWNIQEQLPEFMFDARGRWSGTLASHPAKQNISYVVMIDEEGNQYKTKGWAGENATSVTLYWANGFENSNVWQLPAGETIYLIMRKCTFKGSIEVEKVDQATYDAYTIDWGSENQAIENTVVTEKAHKQIIDGQLVIIRGDKMYDATGKEL